jgi:hypothetical protein
MKNTMRWAGHIMCLGERRNGCKIVAGKTEGRIHLGELRLVGRTVINRETSRVYIGLNWLTR